MKDCVDFEEIKREMCGKKKIRKKMEEGVQKRVW